VVVLVASSMAQASEYRPNEVIVKYRDGSMRTRISMNALYESSGVNKVRRFPGIMRGFEQLTLSEGVTMSAAMAILRSDPRVEYVQPNYILRTQPVKAMDGNQPQEGIPCIPGFDIPGCDPDAKLPCLIPGIPFPPGCEDGGGGGWPGQPGEPGTPPSRPELQPAPGDVVPPVADPELAKAYGITKVGATEAWAQHNGSKNFVVAVIDTGIDYNHEDLGFNVWRNPNPSDKNDIAGFDFVHNDGLPFDDNMHGTHCAGTVGATGGNGKGVSGVTQRVSIMGLKFLSGEGSGTTADAIRAIDYAIEHGAKVLSNSWGGRGDSGNQALFEAIERAKAKDVLFIAAAGNDSANNDGSNPSYPAAFNNDNLIAVAATDKDDRLASFSNYGKRTTHLAAPGAGVYSTVPGNAYRSLSGTSMACPHVAGAAALIWSKNPSMNYKQVKSLLLDSVDKLPALTEKTVTGGRLNVLKALRSME
jgi:subtilisin family serine protease